MLDPRSTVVPYDPAWPALFESLRRRIVPALDGIGARVEHVGSTSVPGLAAKPIVDIDVVVPAADQVLRAIERLSALGYVHEGDGGITGREAFVPPSDGEYHHLYVVVEDSEPCRDHLDFRDYLRAQPAEVARYAAVKYDAAPLLAEHRADYFTAKAPIIEAILRRARTHRPNDSGQTRPGWLLDEVGSAGRENLDADHVGRYDTKEDAGASDEVLLLKRYGLDGSSCVVDFGAGTGQFALAVAQVCARVVAVDVSSVMRDVLNAKLATGCAANMEVVPAGFLTYDHQGPPADLVYSRYALHHLPDFWKAVALRRAHGILRPGGTLRLSDVVYSFDPAEAEERIEAWCATGREVADGWSRSELEEHVRDEHSTFTWLLEPMLLRAGFTIEERTYSPDGIFASYVARAT